VTATGGTRGAGIGGGTNGGGGSITINDGVVTATGGTGGAGIGGGGGDDLDYGGGITINGGVVTATGGESGASIGGGTGGESGGITINGGTVTATGGESGTITGGPGAGAGIGGCGCGAGGYYGTGGSITINGGTVTATAGNDNTSAIGRGEGGGSENVTVNYPHWNHWTNTANEAPGTQGSGTFTYSNGDSYIKLEFTGHVPINQAEVDADCMVNLVCICEHVIEEGNANHDPKADDCTKCQNCTIAEIPGASHIAGDWMVDTAATHATDGSRHKECTVCNYVLVTEAIPALGHSYGDWLSDAVNHWKQCSCGDVITVAHTASDWIVDVPAAEFEVGSRHKECTVCSYVLVTEIIPATHVHAVTNSGWVFDAANHWLVCSCGDAIDTAAHTASEWIVDVPAEEFTDGSRHKECTVCSCVLETGVIPATGSSNSIDTDGGNDNGKAAVISLVSAFAVLFLACICGLMTGRKN